MIRKETWIVLAVFVAALAGLLLWQKYGEQIKPEAATPTPEVSSIQLFDMEPGGLQGVKLERSGDRTVAFQRSGGAWQIVQPPDQPGDSAGIESTLGQLEMVTGEPLKNVPELEAMGLNRPKYRLEVTLQNGSTLIAYVGNATPTGSGYYVMNGDKQVMVVNTYALDPILGLIDDLPLLPTPTPAEAYPSPETTPGAETEQAPPAGTP